VAEEVKPKKGLSKKAKKNIRRAVIALAVIGIGGAGRLGKTGARAYPRLAERGAAGR